VQRVHDGQAQQMMQSGCTELFVDGLMGRCPYSEETVMGCRHYEPVSAHGDFPEAAHCKEASVISGSDHVRHTVCRRRQGVAAIPSMDDVSLREARGTACFF